MPLEPKVLFSCDLLKKGRKNAAFFYVISAPVASSFQTTQMKNVILFFASLAISIFSFAQTISDDQDHIKITAANDSLNVRFKDQLFKLRNIQDLDSCLKKNLPGMKLPVVELETYTDLTAINHRAIIVVLDQYRLPVMSERTISDGKPKGAISRMFQ